MVALGIPVAVMLVAAQAESAGAAASDAAPTEVAKPVYGPVAPAVPKPKPVAAPAPAPACQNQQREREIVICAQRPQGYRLNPDVIAAKRAMRSAGRPTRPGPIAMKDNSCATVGPAGCFTAGINLIAAALTAAEMAKRVAQGKEIGSMFLTDPHPTEYQLYLEAKRRREAKEAAAAAVAKAKATEKAVTK